MSEIKDCLKMGYCVMVSRGGRDGGRMGRGQFFMSICVYLSLWREGTCLLALVREGARLLKLSEASGHENGRKYSCRR